MGFREADVYYDLMRIMHYITRPKRESFGDDDDSRLIDCDH